MVSNEIELVLDVEATRPGVTYRGRDSVRRYFANLAANWASAHIVLYRLTRLGDKVLAVCGVRARSRGGDRELSEQVAVVFSFRAGRIATARTYGDEAEARRASRPAGSPRRRD